MKRNHLLLALMATVLIGATGCPTTDKTTGPGPGNQTPESSPMQVYNTDRTTPYDGSDLDFYIQGDDGKTVTATIRSEMLVITYNELPESCVLLGVGNLGGIYSGATDVTINLQGHQIVLRSMDDTKTLRYRQIPSGARQVAIVYFNKDGAFKLGLNEYTVKQGWNFVNNGSSTNPTDYAQNFNWVVE